MLAAGFEMLGANFCMLGADNFMLGAGFDMLDARIRLAYIKKLGNLITPELF